MKLLIPKDREDGWKYIVNACQALGVTYVLYDIYSSDWVALAQSSNVDGCIYRPEFRYACWREVFSERIRFLGQQLNIPLYPRLHELELYESKRRMAYWLATNNISHPKTWIFGIKEEALDFAFHAVYPLIFKTDFGNASQGVRRIKSKQEALGIIKRSFGNGYRIPTYQEGKVDFINRSKAMVRPLYRKLRQIRNIPRDVELDVIIFQEELEIAHEWRIPKVGDSYFGHEKLPRKDDFFRSGSARHSWTVPSQRVFDFARNICMKGNFATMCLDIFESLTGELFVNELQTFFGAYANNQMYREVDGRIEGFRKYFNETSGKWEEEIGEFGQDSCFRLRVKDFLCLLDKNSEN